MYRTAMSEETMLFSGLRGPSALHVYIGVVELYVRIAERESPRTELYSHL